MIGARGGIAREIAGSFSGYRWSDLQEENVSKQNNPRLRKERRKTPRKVRRTRMVMAVRSEGLPRINANSREFGSEMRLCHRTLISSKVSFSFLRAPALLL